jgi:hypothetical protein
MSRSRCLLATIVAVLAVMLGTMASPAVAAAPNAMSQEYAGCYYLAQICPTNPAGDAVYRAVFRGKKVFRAKQMHGKRLRQTRRALAKYGRLEYAGGRELLNPPLGVVGRRLGPGHQGHG